MGGASVALMTVLCRAPLPPAIPKCNTKLFFCERHTTHAETNCDDVPNDCAKKNCGNENLCKKLWRQSETELLTTHGLSALKWLFLTTREPCVPVLVCARRH